MYLIHVRNEDSVNLLRRKGAEFWPGTVHRILPPSLYTCRLHSCAMHDIQAPCASGDWLSS